MSCGIGNKKTSQLVEITAAEIATNDLFYVVDTSARESKKMQAYQLAAWLNASGSLYAFFATFADTASYILGSGVDGTVTSASWSSFAGSTISSSWASSSNSSISSSYALTASYAANAGTGTASSASYLIYSGFVNGTASYALTAGTALVVNTASFLLYTPGASNGTASFAINAGNVNHAITADTASYLSATVGTVASASWAANAVTASFANTSQTAAYLAYSANNGTASYAIQAGTFANRFNYFGMSEAERQDSYYAVIDSASIVSLSGNTKLTDIEAYGNTSLAYTSSTTTVGVITLYAVDLLTGTETILDSVNVAHRVTPALSEWGTVASGTITIPFSLIGQSSMAGTYFLGVTSSAPQLTIDPNRTVRFKVESYADDVAMSTTYPYPIDFYISPPSQSITFSNGTGGPYYDMLPGFLTTGSNTALAIDISNTSQSITEIRYTWKCSSMTDLSCSSNPNLTTLNFAFPSTLVNLYCNSCSLVSIASLSNTAVRTFNCQDNQLTRIPSLSSHITYFNCSNNPLVELPDLGVSMSILIANDTDVTGSAFFPPTLISASLNNCQLQSLPVTFYDGLHSLSVRNNPLLTALPTFPTASTPSSMSFLDANGCGLLSLPTMSYSMSFLDICNNSIPYNDMLFCVTTLVGNGLLNGTLSASGYGAPVITLYNQLTLLSANGWSVTYDSYP